MKELWFVPPVEKFFYPQIFLGVIVRILDGEEILLTKYAKTNYNHYALVAGYCEIGESLEDTVRREVMEEVGLEVGNIRYYKSQPWAFFQSLLVGFFADLKGDRKVTLQLEELNEATWAKRNEINSILLPNVSLTAEMMEKFRKEEV